MLSLAFFVDSTKEMGKNMCLCDRLLVTKRLKLSVMLRQKTTSTIELGAFCVFE